MIFGVWIYGLCSLLHTPTFLCGQFGCTLRNGYYIAILKYRHIDILPYPPRSVGRKLYTHIGVIPFGGFDKTDTPLLHKILRIDVGDFVLIDYDAHKAVVLCGNN